MGVGVIVWYQFLPGSNTTLLPEPFWPSESYDTFKIPYALRGTRELLTSSEKMNSIK